MVVLKRDTSCQKETARKIANALGCAVEVRKPDVGKPVYETGET